MSKRLHPPRPGGRSARTQPADEAPDERTRIWQAVHAIPVGRVSTYGQIALLAGLPGRARLVGRVLSQLPNESRLPWHRVLNASGRISLRGGGEDVQAERLRAEGILFASTRVDLARFGWPAEETSAERQSGTRAGPTPKSRAR